MQRVLIVGAGQGGSALLETLLKTNMIQIVAIADLDLGAPGMVEAKKMELIRQRIGKNT